MASGASTSDLELDTALLRCVYHLYHAVLQMDVDGRSVPVAREREAVLCVRLGEGAQAA